MEKQDINTEHGGQMPGMDMSAGHGTMEHMQQTDMKDGHSKQMNMAGGHMMHMGNLRRKFWVSLVITIPILLLSPMMGMHTSFQITFPGSEWVVLALATFFVLLWRTPFSVRCGDGVADEESGNDDIDSYGYCGVVRV